MSWPPKNTRHMTDRSLIRNKMTALNKNMTSLEQHAKSVSHSQMKSSSCGKSTNSSCKTISWLKICKLTTTTLTKTYNHSLKYQWKKRFNLTSRSSKRCLLSWTFSQLAKKAIKTSKTRRLKQKLINLTNLWRTTNLLEICLERTHRHTSCFHLSKSCCLWGHLREEVSKK